MIILQLISADVKSLEEEYNLTVDKWMDEIHVCEVCGGIFKKNGTYIRSILVDEPSSVSIPFRVQRIKCKLCKKTHALLPSILFPYRRVPTYTIEDILRKYAANETIESLAETIRFAPRTIAKWCQTIQLKMDPLIKWASQKLASYKTEVHWLKGVCTRGRERLLWLFQLLDLLCRLDYPNHKSGVLSLLNVLRPC